MTDRLFAIGDIHGCARELEVLLAGLPLAVGDTVACVGDYIDRGPASRQVIDLLLALRQRAGIRTVFLKGNHEDMCLSYVEQQGLWGEGWHLNGGVATLVWYGSDGIQKLRVESASQPSGGSFGSPANAIPALSSRMSAPQRRRELLIAAGGGRPAPVPLAGPTWHRPGRRPCAVGTMRL